MSRSLKSYCGIDVHKNSLLVCVKYAQGSVIKKEIKKFGTTTTALQRLSNYLFGFGVKQVAMESTGVYWMPIFNQLEKDGIEVILANARNVKNVPGRKTDVKDCEWICTY